MSAHPVAKYIIKLLIKCQDVSVCVINDLILETFVSELLTTKEVHLRGIISVEPEFSVPQKMYIR